MFQEPVMSLRFKPMPGLTLAVLICLPILIGLGVWQYQRWQWKQDILAEVDASVTAPPIIGLKALSLARTSSKRLDFRRIEFDAEAVGTTWHVYRPDGAIQWQPFRQVEIDGDKVLVGFPSFEDQSKDIVAPPDLKGSRAGYVRRIRPRSGAETWFGTDSDPDRNQWFELNPDGVWIAGATLYIDLHPTETDAYALPVRRPEIANNHVSYMLTWWSFAAILLIIYGILHRRAGRLSWS